MGDQVRLSRGKLRPPGRGAKKPGAHHPASERASPAAFQAFGELQQREFERSPWPMRIFEHGTFRFLAVNDAAVKLYGYTREEFLAMTAKDTRHPEELDDFLTTLNEPTGYFRHRGPRRHVRKNGEVIVVEAVTQDILYNGRKARLSMNIDVTQRNKAEEEVRRQKQLLETVINNIPTRIFIRDAKTSRYVMRNRFSEENSGHPIGSSIGKSVYDLYPREYADLFSSTDAEALKTGRLVEIPELGVTGKSGEPRIRHVRKVPVFDENGQPWVIVGISDDITERKVVERALHESEKKYRDLVESSSDLIWSADAAGRLTFVNEAVRRIYGYEPEEMLGKPVAELLGDGFWRKPFGFFRKMLTEDRSVADYECEVRSRHGERVVLSSNAIVLRDDQGRRIGVSGVSKDITARKKIEAELRQSEERFRQLAENIRQVFWINTLAGDQIDYVSPGFEEIWGRSRESLYRDPRSWMEPIHPEDLPDVLRGQEKMARGEHTEVEFRLIRPDGTRRWINDRSYPMKRSDGTQLVCGIAEDITDRKRAEQERLTHAIRQRDALVREVHHRIKNSLQGIVGLLRQKVSKYPAVAHEIEDTIAQLRSVALVYGLQETRPDGLLDLADVTDAICTSAESLIGGRVERIFERRSRQPVCIAGTEAVSVAVALNELIVNALKHQPAEAGEKHVRVHVCEGTETAEICISNRGSLPKSFDFAEGRAVGIGLGLVRTLLASPGGNVVFSDGRDRVEVVLRLTRPLLAEREMARAE